MKEKYKIINNFLNAYCNTMDDSFFLKNLDYYFELSMGVYEIINIYDSKIGEQNIEKATPISGTESLEIASNFIKEKVPKYEERFEQYLRNGVFDFHDDSECQFGASSGEEDNHRFIDVNLHYNYTDPPAIIHEFMHQINLEQGVYHQPRYTLTEAISIYYETLVFDYMESVGYDRQQVNMARRFRTIDCYDTSMDLINKILLLNSYLSFGPLSDETYEEREKYELSNWADKDEYIKTINTTFKQLTEPEFIFPDELARYILGTLIAYDSVTKNMNINKFDKLNKYIKYESVLNSLSKVGIDISNAEGLLNSFKNEVERIDDNLKEESKKKK